MSDATVHLKQRILAGEPAFGTMVFEFFVPGLPAIVAATGASFLLLDMEHTGATFETIKAQCAACRGLGLVPLVRVPTAEYDMIARALDVGAHGVMIPMVETAEQARAIVEFAHYPPRGRRGAAFGVAHDDYRGGTPSDKMREAGARTLIIPQIETAVGLSNVEAIAKVDGVDIVWVGHFDLTNFMGIPGDFASPEFDAAFLRIAAAAKAAGKPAGVMASDMGWAERAWKAGYRVVAYGLDHLIYQQALRSGIEGLRGLR